MPFLEHLLKNFSGNSHEQTEVMSNYTNHLADTPIDKPFQQSEWRGREAA